MDLKEKQGKCFTSAFVVYMLFPTDCNVLLTLVHLDYFMKSARIGIYTRVVEVSENERLNVASECKCCTKHFSCCNSFYFILNEIFASNRWYEKLVYKISSSNHKRETTQFSHV